MCLVDDRFAAPASPLSSLVALPEATVTLRGARWPRERERLALGGRGVHNEVGPGGRVTVVWREGRRVLREGRFGLAHE